MTWQQIETAPKDGTELDLWVKATCGHSFRLTDCKWGVSDWSCDPGWIYEKRDDDEPHRDVWVDVEYDYGVGCVTHWQPLPLPPETT